MLLFDRRTVLGVVLVFVVALVFPPMEAKAEVCTFFNTTARVCIFDQSGVESCTETPYTDLVCLGPTIGGPGFLPYFPAGGGGGGGGPIGYPTGDGIPTPNQKLKLDQGKNRALAELAANPLCAGLPQALGLGDFANLTNTINNTTYRNWNSHGRCSGGAEAFTYPNWKHVYLCRSFENATTQRAGQVVIHEALHSAGLHENPPDPGALTPEQIDAAVAQACTGL